MLRVIHGFLVLSEEAWPLFIPPVSRTRASTIGPQQTHAVTFMSCFTSRLTRFTQASSCPTRAWKRAWRWKSSGSRATPRRNIAPSGPPRPTPSTQCGTRSLSCLRRFAPNRRNLAGDCGSVSSPSTYRQLPVLSIVTYVFSVFVTMDRSYCQKWQLSGLWFTKRMASFWDTGSSQLMPSSQVGEAERRNTKQTLSYTWDTSEMRHLKLHQPIHWTLRTC